MLLLSRIFPKLRSKTDKNKGVTSEADFQDLGEKPQLEFNCKVILLDDSELALNVKASAKGQAVLDKVYCHLNLIEKDYFGLRFLDSTSQTHWLDPSKTVGTQVKTLPPHKFYFGVKFYAADPCKLHEEITRYQFFMQLKRDILQGRLPVSFDLSAELAAYSVQSELGDYDSKRHSIGYISEFRFIPSQTEDFELRVCQLHKMLMGQVPAAAEYRFLDKAKWLEMYGVDLHPVQGEGNIQYFLGLTPTGIVVYRNKNKVGNYFWPRLTKITFKGKFFMVRVRDKNNDENTYAFECICKPACKHLWKCCIEHHAFFRLTSANDSYKNIGGRLFNFGSKYRYSGRTERQVLTDAQNRTAPKVVRRPSKRHQRRASSEGRIETNYSHLPNPDTDTMVAATAVLSTGAHKRAPYHRAEGYQSAPDSPRSTRSAPWLGSSKHKGGLYTSGRESPLSVRSEKMMFPKRIASGSESESGYARRRAPADYTESESEAQHQRHRRHRKSTESLPYQDSHWKDIQQRVKEGNNGYQLRPNGSVTSVATDPTGGARRRRKRSRSPGNRKPPEELAQHFKYIDPAEEGISEEQMKEIGYEQVLVNAMPAINVKKATRSRHKSPKRRSYGELSERSLPAKSSVVIPAGEAPPPYTADQSRKARGRQRSQPNLNYTAEAKPRVPVPDPYLHNPTRVPVPDPYLHNPTAVQRHETHDAPIVKTKPMAYASPIMSAPLPSDPLPSPVTPGDGSMKHTRDDSGLGAEQDNGSLNSSSSYAQRCFYAEPNASTPHDNHGNMPGTAGAVSVPPIPERFNTDGTKVFSPIPQYEPTPGIQAYPPVHSEHYATPPTQYTNGGWTPLEKNSMRSPAGSTSSHTISQNQPPTQSRGHIYQNQHIMGYSQPKAIYSEQVLSESTHHHNNVSASRHHHSVSSNGHRYHPHADHRGYIARTNNTFSPPSSSSRYSHHNGSSRSHSEKMTEL